MTTPVEPQTSRFRRLFGATEGLLIVAVAWDALIVAFLSLFSGPVRSLGLAGRLGIALGDTGRTGRIVMLYHLLAAPFVAAIGYFILDQVPVRAGQKRAILPPLTAGYMLSSGGGFVFGYWGRNWLAHGLFLVGLSLLFYAGVLLAVALWPGRGQVHAGGVYTRFRGLSLERLAFFMTTVLVLVSAVLGGGAAAFFGNGFVAFLAEDVVRLEHTILELAIIAHLHIMLTLVDVALLLLIIRYFDVQGRAHQWAVPLTIVGTVIVTLATWSVTFWEQAHKLINVGSAFLLPGAIIVAFWGLARIVRQRLIRLGIERPSLGQRIAALFHDPVRLGIFFELIFVNLVVTGPGVYVAINLDAFRAGPFEIERGILVGHWHVLATLSAVLMLLLIADRTGLRGWLRQVVGWGLLLGSSLAFVLVQFYMFRRLGQEVAWAELGFELGIGATMLAVWLFLAAWLAGRGSFQR
ncbi:MAG: hypothetical protein ACOYZ7_12925 [Chloroflexota bacterium]